MRFSKIEQSNEPFDRVTELCGVMVEAFDAADVDSEARCIAFVETEDQMGIAIDGYPDPASAMSSLLHYLQGMFAQTGRKLDIGIFNDKTGRFDFLDEAEDAP